LDILGSKGEDFVVEIGLDAGEGIGVGRRDGDPEESLGFVGDEI
jgi:hypothetical protein